MAFRKAPDFWWRQRGLPGFALAPLAAVYGRIAGRRMDGEGVAAPIPVICIGNLVTGGAGKTPAAIAVARTCRQIGLTPGFLSRGYGGRERGPVLVSLPLHAAHDVGDEAIMLAEHAPTVIAADRPSGAKLLASLGVDVVVMDDGFQNASLAKDLSIVVVDGARAIGNGLVFPAGPLRAPLTAQIRHADAVLVVGVGTGGAATRAAARAGRPVLRARLEPSRRKGMKEKRYLAFAGIGDPRKFFASLTAAGADIGETIAFADHHVFTDLECDGILGRAERADLVPITTEKDRARLAGRQGSAGRLLAALETFPVRLRFEEPRRIVALIEDAVAAQKIAHRRRTPFRANPTTPQAHDAAVKPAIAAGATPIRA